MNQSIFNLEFLRNLNTTERFRVIQVICKVGKPFLYGWATLMDVFRTVAALTNADGEISEGYVSTEHMIHTLPSQSNFKFIRLLRKLAKAPDLQAAHDIQRQYSPGLDRHDPNCLLTTDELTLIKRIIR